MLTTIGKDLDNDAKGNKELRRNVECYYESLRSFTNLSTRVRFSIEDLIELQAVRIFPHYLMIEGSFKGLICNIVPMTNVTKRGNFVVQAKQLINDVTFL